jgi:hypothetical protein
MNGGRDPDAHSVCCSGPGGNPPTKQRETRSRGVRLGDLDRGLAYVVEYVGRRWEVTGPVADGWRSSGGTDAEAGRRPPAAEHGTASGRHSAPESPTR